MDELMRIVRVNREYALEKLDESTTDYDRAYYAGAKNALGRVLEAWDFLGYKVGDDS